MKKNEKLNTYYGDIHNHCGASYGHGPVEDSIANAKMQLDFLSVTGHALWPDMPRQQAGMERRIKYHEDGFKKLENCWDHFVDVTDKANEDGRFVSFLGYEQHSCHSGDQTVMYRDGKGSILKTQTVPELRDELAKLNEQGIACMTFTHHIGYKQGFRGINWKEHKDHPLSPVVELFSMHACSESDDTAYPYLHSMGPCDHDSTYSAGLKLGRIVGCMASTDHHSAHPGSHGHGRLSVRAEELTRTAIWDAILQRRTVALTGDNVEIDFALNDAFMGDVIEEPNAKRNIQFSVKAGGAIRTVELLKNEEVLQHFFVPKTTEIAEGTGTVRAKIGLEVGWGSRGKTVLWDASIKLHDGRILKAEPRFKGSEVVSPTDHEDDFRFSEWKQDGEQSIQFKSKTVGNPTPVTNSNQGFSLEVEMPADAVIELTLNGTTFKHTLREVVAGARSGYIGGYGTPAYRIVAALPESYEFETQIEDAPAKQPLPNGMDVYRLRVEQYNKQWAWSSPIWIAQ
ncbi:hypothetical protein [Pontiella sulfatireligans]|uniref:DUF3604 domain-containing protein n=1 Tax=Pontiella sulfatireligans TaxID=2750658 RepID=A0A6C2USV7_9BACT|nr:hypothetical protein [Pontiella sulfatireligans]VGO22341.1 hypothetical protein SCARR_04424 [Pontiella sulfatireligans]